MRRLGLLLLLLLAACSSPTPAPGPDACVAGDGKKDEKPAEDGGVGGTGQGETLCPAPSE